MKKQKDQLQYKRGRNQKPLLRSCISTDELASHHSRAPKMTPSTLLAFPHLIVFYSLIYKESPEEKENQKAGGFLNVKHPLNSRNKIQT